MFTRNDIHKLAASLTLVSSLAPFAAAQEEVLPPVSKEQEPATETPTLSYPYSFGSPLTTRSLFQTRIGSLQEDGNTLGEPIPIGLPSWSRLTPYLSTSATRTDAGPMTETTGATPVSKPISKPIPTGTPAESVPSSGDGSTTGSESPGVSAGGTAVEGRTNGTTKAVPPCPEEGTPGLDRGPSTVAHPGRMLDVANGRVSRTFREMENGRTYGIRADKGFGEAFLQQGQMQALRGAGEVVGGVANAPLPSLEELPEDVREEYEKLFFQTYFQSGTTCGNYVQPSPDQLLEIARKRAAGKRAGGESDGEPSVSTPDDGFLKDFDEALEEFEESYDDDDDEIELPDPNRRVDKPFGNLEEEGSANESPAPSEVSSSPATPAAAARSRVLGPDPDGINDLPDDVYEEYMRRVNAMTLSTGPDCGAHTLPTTAEIIQAAKQTVARRKFVESGRPATKPNPTEPATTEPVTPGGGDLPAGYDEDLDEWIEEDDEGIPLPDYDNVRVDQPFENIADDEGDEGEAPAPPVAPAHQDVRNLGTISRQLTELADAVRDGKLDLSKPEIVKALGGALDEGYAALDLAGKKLITLKDQGVSAEDLLPLATAIEGVGTALRALHQAAGEAAKPASGVDPAAVVARGKDAFDWITTTGGPVTAATLEDLFAGLSDADRRAATAVLVEMLGAKGKLAKLEELRGFITDDLLRVQVALASINALQGKPDGVATEMQIRGLHRDAAAALKRAEAGADPRVVAAFREILDRIGAAFAKVDAERVEALQKALTDTIAKIEKHQVQPTAAAEKGAELFALGKAVLAQEHVPAGAAQTLQPLLTRLDALVTTSLDRRRAELRFMTGQMRGTIFLGRREGKSETKTGHLGLKDEIDAMATFQEELRQLGRTRGLFAAAKAEPASRLQAVGVLSFGATKEVFLKKRDIQTTYSGLEEVSSANVDQHERLQIALGDLNARRAERDGLADVHVRLGGLTVAGELDRIHFELNGRGKSRNEFKWDLGVRGDLKNALNARALGDLPGVGKDVDRIRDVILFGDEIAYLEGRRMSVVFAAPELSRREKNDTVVGALMREVRLIERRAGNSRESVNILTGSKDKLVAEARARYDAAVAMGERLRVGELYGGYVKATGKGDVQNAFEALVRLRQAHVDGQLSGFARYLTGYADMSWYERGFGKARHISRNQGVAASEFFSLTSEMAILQDALTQAAFKKPEQLTVAHRSLLEAHGFLKGGKYLLPGAANLQVALIQARNVSADALSPQHKKLLEGAGLLVDGEFKLPEGGAGGVTTLGDDFQQEYVIDRYLNAKQFAILAATVALPGGLAHRMAGNALGSQLAFRTAAGEGLSLAGVRAAASGAARWTGERGIEAGLFTVLNRGVRTGLDPRGMLAQNWGDATLSELKSNFVVIASLHLGGAGMNWLAGGIAKGAGISAGNVVYREATSVAILAGEAEILTQLHGLGSKDAISAKDRVGNLLTVLQLRAFKAFQGSAKPNGRVGRSADATANYLRWLDGARGARENPGRSEGLDLPGLDLPGIPSPRPTIEPPVRPGGATTELAGGPRRPDIHVLARPSGPTIEGPRAVGRPDANGLLGPLQNPAHFLRSTYGQAGDAAARAYERIVDELGPEVLGVAGSYALGRARIQTWDASYEVARAIDKYGVDGVLDLGPRMPSGPIREAYELLMSTGRREFPSDLDVPVRTEDAYALDALAREIYDETGVLVEFTDPQNEGRPDVDVTPAAMGTESATLRMPVGGDTLPMNGGGAAPVSTLPRPFVRMRFDPTTDPAADVAEASRLLGPIDPARSEHPAFEGNEFRMSELQWQADIALESAQRAVETLLSSEVEVTFPFLVRSANLTEWTPAHQAMLEGTLTVGRTSFGWKAEAIEGLRTELDALSPRDRLRWIYDSQRAMSQSLWDNSVFLSEAQGELARHLLIARRSGLTERDIAEAFDASGLLSFDSVAARVRGIELLHDMVLERNGRVVLEDVEMANELHGALVRVFADAEHGAAAGPAAGAAEARVLWRHAQAAEILGRDFFEVLPRLGTTHAEEGFEPFLFDRSNTEVLREFLESHPVPANLNVPNRYLQLYAGA